MCFRNPDYWLFRRFRPPNPEEVGRLFRLKPATWGEYKESWGQVLKFYQHGRYVYEAGAPNHPDEMQARLFDAKVVAKEHEKDFEISRIIRFRYRSRYFTDSGIIGSKEFVAETYHRFK